MKIDFDKNELLSIMQAIKVAVKHETNDDFINFYVYMRDKINKCIQEDANSSEKKEVKTIK